MLVIYPAKSTNIPLSLQRFEEIKDSLLHLTGQLGWGIRGVTTTHPVASAEEQNRPNA